MTLVSISMLFGTSLLKVFSNTSNVRQLVLAINLKISWETYGFIAPPEASSTILKNPSKSTV